MRNRAVSSNMQKDLFWDRDIMRSAIVIVEYKVNVIPLYTLPRRLTHKEWKGLPW